jgi:CheY-like chemotaxis protein
VLRLEIQIESGRGKGTRFSVLLPISKAQKQGPVVEARRRLPVIGALNGLKVLCVDNDIRILEGMRLLLQGWGCQVQAYSGSAAFGANEPKAMPDVILVDYHLDDENGLDVIVRLRNMFAAPIPAMLLTADRSNEVREAADRLDVPVLNKPVKPAALRSMISRLRQMTPAAE